MQEPQIAAPSAPRSEDRPLLSGRPGWMKAAGRLRQNKKAMVGFWMVSVFILVAVFAKWIAPYDPLEQNMDMLLKPPSFHYLLGTDEYGRDILSRMMYGAQISLMIGIVGMLVSLILGMALGTISGYFGGAADMIIMRIMDILMAFPGFLLALAIVSVLGPGMTNLMIAIGIFSVPSFARICRSSVLSLNQKEFIEAAKSMGSGHMRIIFNHVLPNSLAPMIVLSSLRIATAILSASGLSFLGMGAQPPTPEWGMMLNTGREFLRSAPHISLIPGLAIMYVVLGFNLLGDGLRDALDPKMKL
ncbi:nickel transporter permease [Paenibacillus filicis]|uniref:Nickel transporter permease n=1 Tax=Paenibacillus filicis TaxID=669464 RepID=A0ABU9DCV7_9BACL